MVKVPSPEAYQKTIHVRTTPDHPPQQPSNGQTKMRTPYPSRIHGNQKTKQTCTKTKNDQQGRNHQHNEEESDELQEPIRLKFDQSTLRGKLENKN
jgi:hypothetical protein